MVGPPLAAATASGWTGTPRSFRWKAHAYCLSVPIRVHLGLSKGGDGGARGEIGETAEEELVLRGYSGKKVPPLALPSVQHPRSIKVQRPAVVDKTLRYHGMNGTLQLLMSVRRALSTSYSI